MRGDDGTCDRTRGIHPTVVFVVNNSLMALEPPKFFRYVPGRRGTRQIFGNEGVNANTKQRVQLRGGEPLVASGSPAPDC
jgi:hypothetical protein